MNGCVWMSRCRAAHHPPLFPETVDESDCIHARWSWIVCWPLVLCDRQRFDADPEQSRPFCFDANILYKTKPRLILTYKRCCGSVLIWLS
jgi:hypothetical protein